MGAILDVIKMVITQAERRRDRRDRHLEAKAARVRQAPFDEMARGRRFEELIGILRNSRNRPQVARALREARDLARPPKSAPPSACRGGGGDWAQIEPLFVSNEAEGADNKDIEQRDERFEVEAVYVRNAVSPLLPFAQDIPREWHRALVDIRIGTLPARYGGGDAIPDGFMQDMQTLTRRAIATGADPEPIAAFVVQRHAGHRIMPQDLQQLLAATRKAGDESPAYAGPHYLNALRGSTVAIRVDVLAAVSRDVLEASRAHTFTISGAGSATLLEYAVALTDARQTFGRIGELPIGDPSSYTDSDDAAALMLKAMAAVSPYWSPDHGGGDAHLLKRILERFPDVLGSFKGNTAAFRTDGTAEMLADGVAAICKKCPERSLTARTVAAAKELVPWIDAA